MATTQDGRLVVATAGTRVQLPLQSGGVAMSVAVQALATNTGIVTVGSSTVVAAAATRRGIGLSAGQVVSLDTDDVSDLWIDAVVSGEGVSYLCTLR